MKAMQFHKRRSSILFLAKVAGVMSISTLTAFADPLISTTLSQDKILLAQSPNTTVIEPEPRPQNLNTTVQSIDDVTLEQLKNRTVVNAKGDVIGEFGYVVIEKDNESAGAIIHVGGLWGTTAGSKKVFADINELSLDQNRIVWNTKMTKHQLMEAGTQYKQENYSDVSMTEYVTVGEFKDDLR